MDDYYTSMKENGVLESQENEPQTNTNTNINTLYVADALVPLNVARWPSFIAGSTANSDMPDLSGKLGTPFANLQVAQKYLSTAQSDAQYRCRLWQLAEDTATINAICEIANEPGSFAAGAMANEIADQYMDEMVETEVTKNLNEELNMEIFRATAGEQQRDPQTVRGTGTIRQNVPDYMRGDLCDRPKKGEERPLEWNDSGGLDEDGLGSGSKPNPLRPNGSPNGNARSLSDSISSSDTLGPDQDISSNQLNSNNDEETGGFFARCFGWLGSGGGGAESCLDPSLSSCPAENLYEQPEEFYMDMGGSSSGMCLEIDHPAYSPPAFCGEFISPPDL